MYARAVDEAGLRLRELRREEWSDFALAAVALAAALAASYVRPGFAVPLFVGGLFAGVRGVTAAWHRWEIVDELASEPGAYVIDEIRAHAMRETTMKRRLLYAASIRVAIGAEGDRRLSAVVSELDALAAALEDDELALDPACAVACARLVGDPYRSPLLDRFAPLGDVRTQVRHIRGGFVTRDSAP